MTVDEQFDAPDARARWISSPAELKKKLTTGEPLTVKVGFDPTARTFTSDTRSCSARCAQFQDLGHRVIFVIGDFTGMIGDPTGRQKTRPPLTRDQIGENAETYKRQCFKVLDPVKTEIRFNSEWLEALGVEGFIRLAAKYNVARMLERKDFKTRYASWRPDLDPRVPVPAGPGLRLGVPEGGRGAPGGPTSSSISTSAATSCRTTAWRRRSS